MGAKSPDFALYTACVVLKSCRARRFKRRLHCACKGRACELGRARPHRSLSSCFLTLRIAQKPPTAQSLAITRFSDCIFSSFLPQNRQICNKLLHKRPFKGKLQPKYAPNGKASRKNLLPWNLFGHAWNFYGMPWCCIAKLLSLQKSVCSSLFQRGQLSKFRHGFNNSSSP